MSDDDEELPLPEVITLKDIDDKEAFERNEEETKEIIEHAKYERAVAHTIKEKTNGPPIIPRHITIGKQRQSPKK